jgi:hypothetical protein
MNEYPFSIGGNDLKLAMELIDGVEGFRIRENMYIDDDEFEMEMGRSKKDSLKKEMMIHVDQLIDGNIDMNDFMNVVEDVMAEVNSLKESTGPSDKAETEDDVVNIDKVAGPSAKGTGYGAETSANTAEDDQEDKEIENPRPMYENGHTSDFTSELKEASAEESIAKYITDYYTNPKTGEKVIDDDIIMSYFKTHPDYEERFDGTEEGMKDGLDDFQEFLYANYDIPSYGEMDEDKTLKEHFKRFM